MKKVESIYPYTIVEEGGFYGITDNKGNLVVPCVMDVISNEEDEEVGLTSWGDYSCVILYKDGIFGFFTNNGKFIEPAYNNYAVDPSGNDIYVETDEGYGVLRFPDYTFEEIAAEDSLLGEMGFDCFDEYDDYEEYDELDEPNEDDEPLELDDDVAEFFAALGRLNESTRTWGGIEIDLDVVSAIQERLYTFGYEYAQELWDSACSDGNQVNIEKFIADILSKLNDYATMKENLEEVKAQGDSDEDDFWELLEDGDEAEKILPWCVNSVIRGVASFISLEGMSCVNISQLNRKISKHLKDVSQNGYYSIFRLIDRYLPNPEYGTFEYTPVKLPVGKRPACSYSTLFKEGVEGEIGEIYLFEHSMHMSYTSVNVYDSENPEELLDEKHILNLSDSVLSELLTSFQQAVDPDKEDKELSAAISRAIEIENSKPAIVQILKECGVYLLSLSDFECHPRYCDGNIVADVDYLFVSGDDLMLVMESSSPLVSIVPLNESSEHYSWIVEEIKAAANMAYKKSKE